MRAIRQIRDRSQGARACCCNTASAAGPRVRGRGDDSGSALGAAIRRCLGDVRRTRGSARSRQWPLPCLCDGDGIGGGLRANANSRVAAIENYCCGIFANRHAAIRRGSREQAEFRLRSQIRITRFTACYLFRRRLAPIVRPQFSADRRAHAGIGRTRVASAQGVQGSRVDRWRVDADPG